MGGAFYNGPAGVTIEHCGLAGEMFPARIRGRAIGANVIMTGIANALTTAVFPPTLAGLGGAGAFALHGAVSVLALGFIYTFVVETRGKEPAEISAELAANVAQLRYRAHALLGRAAAALGARGGGGGGGSAPPCCARALSSLVYKVAC